MRDLLFDIRYAFRGLLRSPALCLVAVFAIAVGIGANTIVYSIVHATLLDPYPAADVDDLYILQATRDEAPRRFGDANFLDLRRSLLEGEAPTFQHLVASRTTGLRITESDRPLMPAMRRVSAGYFQAFGVQLVLGREFVADEDRPGRDHVAVLTHSFWRDYYGSDGGVVGRSIELLGENYEVVGVLPEGHRDPFSVNEIALYLPLAFDTATAEHAEPLTVPFLNVFGRPADGVRRGEMEAALELAAEDLSIQFAAANEALGFRTTSVREQATGDTAPILWTLLAAVVCVLLIACGNVANLLLARSIGRRQEISVRRALGAGAGHLVRQLTAEGMVLATAGALLGTALAYVGLDSVLHWVPPNFSGLPLEEIRLDAGVLVFTLGLTAAVGLVFGLVPALHALRNENDALSAGAVRSVGSRGDGNGRKFLVAAEVAVSLALLVAAGLTVQSALRLSRLSVGLDPQDVTTFRTSARGEFSESDETRARFHRQVLENLQGLPGVEAAATIHFTPVQFPWQGRPMEIAGFDVEVQPMAMTKAASPGYFDTLSIPLLSGRDFTSSDRLGGEEVVIVNRTLAERFWPGETALDRRVILPQLGSEPRRVIGVVGDLRDVGDDPTPKPQVYVPNLQFAPASQNYMVKTRLRGDALADAVRQAVWAVDPDSPVYAEQSMTRVVDDRDWRSRFAMRLLSAFGVLALVLAGSGIYGVLSFLVSRQRKEMGVRMAMGARRVDVLALVVGRAMQPTVMGLVAGLGLAAVAGKLIESRLYGVQPFDPVTLAGVTLVLLAVAVVASLVPALRATRVDPARVLYEE